MRYLIGDEKIEQNAERLKNFIFGILGCSKEDAMRVVELFVKKYIVGIENSGNYVAFSPEFSNGQSSRTKFLNASRIKIRILDVLKTSNTINRIVHNQKDEKRSQT